MPNRTLAFRTSPRGLVFLHPFHIFSLFKPLSQFDCLFIYFAFKRRPHSSGNFLLFSSLLWLNCSFLDLDRSVCAQFRLIVFNFTSIAFGIIGGLKEIELKISEFGSVTSSRVFELIEDRGSFGLQCRICSTGLLGRILINLYSRES